MTNSTPKNNNKVERQGSPNSHGKQKRNSNYIKTVTYFANSNNNGNNNNSSSPTNIVGNSNSNGSGGRNSRASNGRQSSTSPCSSTKNISRSSPMRYDSPRGSPTSSFYAGAKFSEPPSPNSLPKPPMHWTGFATGCQSEMRATYSTYATYNLKMILNVQA